MLGLIIRKEILENLLNARFVTAILLSVILMVSAIVVLSLNHQEEMRDYQKRVEQQEGFTDEFGHVNRILWMTRPMRVPPRLQTLVLGIDREAEQLNFLSNPVPVLFSRLDLVFVVTIIMSLMAILFSHNTICGEREAGLLRQMLSMGVSRRTLIAGKYWGGTLSLLVPFTVGILAGFLTLALISHIGLTLMDAGVFLVLLTGSWLYTMVFFGMGMLCSATSRGSGQSILKALFIWVILVLVIPNVSPCLAAELYRVPSVAKVEKERTWILSDERDEILRREQRKMLESTFSDLAWMRGLSQNEIQSRSEADPRFRSRLAEYARAYDEMVAEVNRQQSRKDELFTQDFLSRAARQEVLATVLASFSPLTNFIFIATDATETGTQGESHFGELRGQFENALMAYASAEYQKEKENNPSFGSNDYLDLRGRPRFQYQQVPFMDRLDAVAPHAGILLAFTLLFLGAAMRFFFTYDVR